MNVAKRFHVTSHGNNPVTHSVLYTNGNEQLNMLASFQTDEQIINAALDSCKYDSLVKGKYSSIVVRRKTGRRDSEGNDIWINVFKATV